MKFNSMVFYLSGFVMTSLFLIMSTLVIFLYSGGEIMLEWEGFSMGGLSIVFLGLLDFISVLFLSTVLLISGSVMLFSSSYMSADKFSGRFALLVISFVLSMALLICSPSMISLLLGWDGLGVTSFLLVCYYSSEKSFNASMLTALTNRLGDVAILVAIATLSGLGLFNYGVLSSSNMDAFKACFFLIVLAGMTKSAQIPFSSWLPAAMAAPTPVSALVHSSTLVTAGVYLLIRFNYIIINGGYAHYLLLMGSLTMFMAGGAALLELDMKKIIALSTLSQLGVMFFSLGLGQAFLSFFHLISHAYFKAMLFMAAGAMIHSVKDYQDLRKMGSNSTVMLLIASTMLISNLSLCGLPFLSGFYSKDLILEVFIMQGYGVFSSVMMMGATILTACYSIRFTVMVFKGGAKREAYSQESETSALMFLGMSILIFPSIMGGWWITGVQSSNSLVFLPLWMKLSILTLIIIISSWLLLNKFTWLSPKHLTLKAFHQMWFMPMTFSPIFSSGVFLSSKHMVKASDMSWSSLMTWGWAFNNSHSGLNFSSVLRGVTLSSLLLVLVVMLI